MGLERLLKREIAITITVVCLVTTLFVMFSYAIFKVDTTGETNVITFGDIKLTFCQDSTCDSSIPNMGNVIGTETVNGTTTYVPIYPQNDPTTTTEWNALKPYIFKITNSGSLPLNLSLYLEKDTTATSFTQDRVVNGTTYTESFTAAVDDSEIKIAIGEYGSTPTIKLYSETSNTNGEHELINNVYLEPNASKIFSLYAWLKSDAANASQGKYFVTLITARGEYVPES